MADLLLIHPPAALPCEPPVGAAMLARRLGARGLSVEVVDANLEALCDLLGAVRPSRADTVVERRALGARERSLSQLRSRSGFQNEDRHASAVLSLRRILALSGGRAPAGARVDLADYDDPALSPMRTADLRLAAARHAESPYAPTFGRLADRIAASPPRALGISVSYLHQALPALALAGAVRERLPGLRILAGGSLLGCFAGRLAPDGLAPAVDHVVFGDGEQELLLAAGAGGGGSSYSFPEKREPVDRAGGPGARRAAPLLDLPDYAWAPFDLYLSGGRRIVPVATSRGCYYGGCCYCPEASPRRPFASIPRGRLAERLARLRDETGADLLHLTDSAVPPGTLLEIARGGAGGTPWYGFARVSEVLARPEVARGLARSGCAMLQLGLESGSYRVQARLRKGFAPSLASEVLRVLAGEGVAVYLYLLLGVPGETREDALLTLEFVEEHARFVDYLNTSLLNLPVSSPEEEGVRRLPFSDGNDLSLYTGFRAEGGWDRRAARRFLERELAGAPSASAILRRTPKVFGANHAPLFLLERHAGAAA